VAFFYFFSLKRPVEIIKKVIISLCVSSFIACVVAVFGGLGIIPAIRDEFYISSQQVLFSRTYTGVSSSFLGGFVAILLSSYWLLANKINKKRLVIIAFIMIICFEISFITAQRSIVVMVLMAILVITYIILFRWRKNDYLISLRSFFKKNIISIFLLNLALLSILMILYNSGGGTLGFRVSSTGPQDAAFASRMDVWKYFISDIFTQPNLIGEGDKNILNQIGTGAHSIFVEAYYYGGILMIISLVSCYFIAMKISFSKIKVRSNKEFSIIYMFLFTALILLFFYLLYMPGLYSKIPYVLLGLAFSLSDKK